MRHNAIFFAGSMAVAFMNYLYYPLIGRLLPTASFGEVQVIISSYLQLTIILSVLTNVTVNILVNGHDSKKARATVRELEKIALYFGIAVFILIAASSVQLATILKFSSPLPFIAIALAFLLAVPATFRTAYLQAHKQFTASSVTSFVSSAARLLFSTILVLLALQTFGAVLGLALAVGVGFWLSNRQAVKAGYKDGIQKSRRRPDFSLIRPEAPYALFVLFMTLLTTLQISIDVTLIKYYLPPDTAGDYAAIATIARIIYFLTGSVLAVMLSSIGRSKPIKENVKTLVSSGSLIVGLGGAATIFFVLFPTFTTHLLFGSRYDSLTHLLPLLSVAVFVGSTLNLLVTFNTALRNYTSIIFLILGSLTSLLFVILNTKTIEHIITGLLLGSGVALIGLAIYTVVASLKMHKNEEARK